jgi:hypothetical protein
MLSVVRWYCADGNGKPKPAKAKAESFSKVRFFDKNGITESESELNYWCEGCK